MRKIKTIMDIVERHLCVGCGACYYACDKGAVTLHNLPDKGIKPQFKAEECAKCTTDCLAFCPGYGLENGITPKTFTEKNYNIYFGSTVKIWEGYAADEKIRHAAASGGAVSALALYCLEKEGMPFAQHTGMDPENPLLNKTFYSTDYKGILQNTGSRYTASSPCDGLKKIETSNRPAVFIGKPCDAGAVRGLRKIRPELDKKLGIVLSFFCAGTPHTNATKDLIKKLNIDIDTVTSVRYRGNGWPGYFTVESTEQKEPGRYTYDESWSYINKFRPFRCHLCPDGTGELSDITCGDAWHSYTEDDNPGQSLILARTERGREIVEKAIAAGYLIAKPVTQEEVVKAQRGLVNRRKDLYGRLMILKLMGCPVPRYNNFFLKKAWKSIPLSRRIKVLLSTLKRVFTKKLLAKEKITFPVQE